MTTGGRNIIARAVTDAGLLLAVFFLPWWTALLFALVPFFAFKRFIELVLAAFLMDLLYGIRLPRFGGFEFMLSLLAILLYVAGSFLKRRMRF